MSRGKRFETDIVNMAKRRFPDAYVERNVDKTFGKKNISLPSPPDIIINSRGENYLIECKSTQGKSLPFTNIKAHQEEYLDKYARISVQHHGGYAVLFYKKGTQQKRAFLMHEDVMAEYRRTATRKSYPISLFEKWGLELLWRSGVGWVWLQ